MRIIKNLDDSRTKYGDTNTVFRLNLLDNEELVDTTNKTLRLNIANESGLVLSKEVKTDFTGYIELDFSDPELQKLTPDHYLLEYEYTLPDGDVAKYPTTGGLAFTITSNLKETKGGLVPNITFDEVLTAVDEKIAVYLATVKKGDKGDTGSTGATGQNGKDGKDGKDSDVLSTKANVFTAVNTFNQPITGILTIGLAPQNNLDDLIVNARYKINTSYTSIPSGMPNGAFIDVMNFDNNVVYQIITARQIGSTTTKSTQWIRMKMNGVWNVWQSIAKDDDVVHKTGSETLKDTKTFEKPIDGSIGIITTTTETSLISLVKSAITKYGSAFSKQYIANNKLFSDTPSNYDASVLIEISIRDNGRGYVKLTDGNSYVYVAAYANDKFDGAFIKQARDSDVVHKVGNETIAGDKVLTGKTTIASKEMTDAGWVDITLASGAKAVFAKYRILFGVVYIHVQQISGKAALTPYFTLPDGIRPPDIIFQTWFSGGKFGNNQLQPDGQFMCASGGSDASTTVSFYTQYPI